MPVTVTLPVVATDVLVLAGTVTASAPASAPLCPTVTFTVGSPVAAAASDR
ncbi:MULTISPECIES: hypothetical protein [Streptomyces]|uniref:hypothetical protein n=1 Tax=Streptomyces TaxID=1883 RepID=UPI003863C1EE